MGVEYPEPRATADALNEPGRCRRFVVPKLQATGGAYPAVLTRRRRADRVKKQETAFFDYFEPEARDILNDLLEKYASDGELQFILPDVLKVPPISQRGNVNEIVGKFGDPEKLRDAISRLQEMLYDK